MCPCSAWQALLQARGLPFEGCLAPVAGSYARTHRRPAANRRETSAWRMPRHTDTTDTPQYTPAHPPRRDLLFRHLHQQNPAPPVQAPALAYPEQPLEHLLTC